MRPEEKWGHFELWQSTDLQIGSAYSVVLLIWAFFEYVLLSVIGWAYVYVRYAPHKTREVYNRI